MAPFFPAGFGCSNGWKTSQSRGWHVVPHDFEGKCHPFPCVYIYNYICMCMPAFSACRYACKAVLSITIQIYPGIQHGHFDIISHSLSQKISESWRQEMLSLQVEITWNQTWSTCQTMSNVFDKKISFTCQLGLIHQPTRSNSTIKLSQTGSKMVEIWKSCRSQMVTIIIVSHLATTS